MVIKVVSKGIAPKYSIICTDKTCRNVIEFDFDDVTWVNRSSMGRVVDTVQGISCPDCRQVLPFKDANPLEE